MHVRQALNSYAAEDDSGTPGRPASTCNAGVTGMGHYGLGSARDQSLGFVNALY